MSTSSGSHIYTIWAVGGISTFQCLFLPSPFSSIDIWQIDGADIFSAARLLPADLDRHAGLDGLLVLFRLQFFQGLMRGTIALAI